MVLDSSIVFKFRMQYKGATHTNEGRKLMSSWD